MIVTFFAETGDCGWQIFAGWRVWGGGVGRVGGAGQLRITRVGHQVVEERVHVHGGDLLVVDGVSAARRRERDATWRALQYVKKQRTACGRRGCC